MVMKCRNTKPNILVTEVKDSSCSQSSASLPSPVCSPNAWRTRWRLPEYPGTPHFLLSSPSSGGLMAMADLWETCRSMAAFGSEAEIQSR